METLKNNLKLIFGVIMMFITGAFLYERSRRKSAEAIADNKDVLDKINESDKVITKNNGLLEAEEQKREDIKKEATDAKNDSDGADDAEFFRKR